MAVPRPQFWQGRPQCPCGPVLLGLKRGDLGELAEPAELVQPGEQELAGLTHPTGPTELGLVGLVQLTGPTELVATELALAGLVGLIQLSQSAELPGPGEQELAGLAGLAHLTGPTELAATELTLAGLVAMRKRTRRLLQQQLGP